MHLPTLGALALCACAARAFQDTSPFMFFSTSEILFSSPQITTASSLTGSLLSKFQECPGSNVYVVAYQPGVSSADFTATGSTPYLRKWVSGAEKHIRSSLSVAEVLGEMESASVVELLERSCGAGTMHVDASTGMFDIVDDARPQIVKIDFPSLPEKDRDLALRENDLFLSNLLRVLPTQNYTVFYTTSPVSSSSSGDGSGSSSGSGRDGKSHLEEPSTYEMDQSGSPLSHHQELKRDGAAYHRRQEGDSSDSDDDNIKLPEGPLFERYQFFTPGLFMAFLVVFVLLSIMYVAISAISSLQVSYAAFDKENGPAAQKPKVQ